MKNAPLQGDRQIIKGHMQQIMSRIAVLFGFSTDAVSSHPVSGNLGSKLGFGHAKLHNAQDDFSQRRLVMLLEQRQQLVPNPIAAKLEEFIALVFAILDLICLRELQESLFRLLQKRTDNLDFAIVWRRTGPP